MLQHPRLSKPRWHYRLYTWSTCWSH